jgi:phage tail sheath protein FI
MAALSYTTPGVYVEEVQSGAHQIEAVGTSTAAFLGRAPLATEHVNEAIAVNSWEEFKKYFVFGEKNYAGMGAQGPPAGVTTTPLAQAVRGFFDNEGARAFIINLGPGENLEGSGGAGREGVALLEELDEVAIVAAPGMVTAQAYEALLLHCEKMKDRVAVLDGPEDVKDLGQLVDIAAPDAGEAAPGAGGAKPAGKQGLRARRSDGGYGAYYYPYFACVNALDPSDKKLLSVPPSGHIAGIYARVDRTRGVFKAPANEVVRGALNVVRNVTDSEQGMLNPQCVNVSRRFTGDATRCWGARSLAAGDSDWRYISVRRTFAMIEKSIKQGTRWAVFEPNDRLLWRSLRVSVTAFLKRLWSSGALLGRTPEEAFFVKCDEETNPPEVRDAGQLVLLLGLSVVKPAEFVILRIAQGMGGVETGEGHG